MRFQTLSEWLQWQEKLHFTEVDPGLERVGYVWRQLGGKSKLPFTVITVAGTNGKGSSVAMLDSILCAAGYHTGTYTSPHLLRYNERICVDGHLCDDDLICESFNRIDHARGQTSLTYFEFSTLAAVDIFCQQKIDIAILEVGMGGRLDAVNLFDTDIALITPISLDHTTWLGTNREQIGTEKAGIMRQGRPVVFSESKPPKTVLSHAQLLQSPTFLANFDFNIDYDSENDGWGWTNQSTQMPNLPLPALAGTYQIQNAAAVLQVIALLNDQDFTISEQHIKTGLTTVRLAGRFQRIQGDVEQIFDVTHNQQGAENLVNLLSETPCKGRTIAVLAMLKDKDVSALAATLKTSIDAWYVAGLQGSRGMTGKDLAAQVIETVGNDKVISHRTVVDAYQQAMKAARKGDRILVFGSFHTVESVIRLQNKESDEYHDLKP
jgi:dihydrofolate synthase / folylpolyglutamate synthase